MNLMSNRIWARIAVPVMVLVAGLGTWLWILRPDRAVAWAIGSFFLPVMWTGGVLLKRRPPFKSMGDIDRDRLRRAITGAGLILAASFGLAITRELDVLGGGFSKRVFGVVMGAYLVIMGNALPKTLKPLAESRCDPSTAQQVQRFAGWAFALAGLAYAIVWLSLPVEPAAAASTAILAAAVALVAGRLVWGRTRGPRTGPPPRSDRHDVLSDAVSGTRHRANAEPVSGPPEDYPSPRGTRE